MGWMDIRVLEDRGEVTMMWKEDERERERGRVRERCICFGLQAYTSLILAVCVQLMIHLLQVYEKNKDIYGHLYNDSMNAQRPIRIILWLKLDILYIGGSVVDCVRLSLRRPGFVSRPMQTYIVGKKGNQ